MDEAADRRRGEMAELVHHLRQPVSALLLLVDNLGRVELPDEARAWSEAIGREVEEVATVAERMARLLE